MAGRSHGIGATRAAHPGQHAKQRCRQSLPQGGNVVLPARHVRLDPVGDPARQRQAAHRNGLGGQQGVIEAAEAQADHQDDRQPEMDRQVGGIEVIAQGYAEAADTLDQQQVGFAWPTVGMRRR